MNKAYDIEEITKKISKELAEQKSRLAAWEAVTFPTKKDGSPYKVMSKNIEGAKYGLEEYHVQSGEYELTVNGYNNGVYASDSISCYDCVPDMRDEKKLAKVENYQPKNYYLKQVYVYDLEDIKEAVAARIDVLKEEIESLEAQLAVAESAYDSFYESVCEAKKALVEVAGDRTSLFYAIINRIGHDLSII